MSLRSQRSSSGLSSVSSRSGGTVAGNRDSSFSAISARRYRRRPHLPDLFSLHPCGPPREPRTSTSRRAWRRRAPSRASRDLRRHALELEHDFSARLQTIPPPPIPQGEPLPFPIRVSAGFFVIGLSRKMRIQTLPPRLIWRVSATRWQRLDLPIGNPPWLQAPARP